MVARPAAHRFSWEVLARSLRSWTSSSHRSKSAGPNRSRGNSSRTTRYTWGRVIQGIFFPHPVAGSAGTPRRSGTCDVVMPASPEPAPYLIQGAGFVFVQAHVALLGLELSFNSPSGAAHVGQGFQWSVLRSVGEVVTGFAVVQVPAIDHPEDLGGLSFTRYPHPLGAEEAGARPRAVRAAMVISRQASAGNAALRWAMVWRASRNGWGLRGCPRPW